MKTSHLKKIKRNDTIARWVITIGGSLIIFCVVGMFALIAKEAFPLLGGAKTKLFGSFKSENANKAIVFAGLDRYKIAAYVLFQDGTIGIHDLVDKTPIATQSLANPASIALAKRIAGDYVFLQLEDGRSQIHKIGFNASYDENSNRSVLFATTLVNEIEAANLSVVASDATILENEGSLYARILENGSAQIIISSEEENLFGDIESIQNTVTVESSSRKSFIKVALSSDGSTIYFATTTGAIEKWTINDEGQATYRETVPPSRSSDPVSAIALAFGSDSLAASRISGDFATYSMAQLPETGRRGLMPIHNFPEIKNSFAQIQSSPRNKTLYTLDLNGTFAAYYLTTEKQLFRLPSVEPIVGFGLSPKGDAILTWDEENTLTRWDIDSQHPEITVQALFGKIHYETYDHAELVWQSSSGSDDFEPKFSLVPLIFGSLKGTFFSMLFAAPIAILGAIYTSQFANKHMRGIVKPIIELIGAVPSVVIGFLAALWLAPKMESHLASFIAFIPLVMLCVLAMLFLWSFLLRNPDIKYRVSGYEFIVMLPAIICGYLLASTLAPIIETQAFAGNFQQWIYDTLNITYDQRNCFVIAIALGFIVIPILYTMADDALMSVPQSLQAASLAVGATRWQTMMRITLPSASPGIFAAMIIALGRAIGETMIVLMATGNTPILDWSIFNGMRTLSANIAVEIPEAPVGGTLYRVLFLSGILLILFTSTLNTVAEIIRQRLRKKYGKF